MIISPLTNPHTSTAREVAGKLSLKHIYEIAVIKQQDPPLQCLSLKTICEQLIGIARTCGIQVVPGLVAAEYGQFLEERKAVIAQQIKELEEKKEARLLRTG